MKRPTFTIAAPLFFIPTASAQAAVEGSSEHGLDPAVLIGVAVMLVLAKIGGELFERMRQSAVLGELVAGIVLGQLSDTWFHWR